MASAKAKTKKHGLTYFIILIAPVVIMAACGIIFNAAGIIPYMLAYALIAALLGFFMVSKNHGMTAVITSIILILGLTAYVVADGILQRTDLLKDKAFISAMSSALNKFPATISQKDLDKVKVLILDSNIDNFEDQGFRSESVV